MLRQHKTRDILGHGLVAIWRGVQKCPKKWVFRGGSRKPQKTPKNTVMGHQTPMKPARIAIV